MFYNSHSIYALLADLSMAVFAGSQTAIFIRAVAEESRRGLKPPGKVGRDRFSNGASNQISLMKWVYGIQREEPEATDILSYAS